MNKKTIALAGLLASLLVSQTACSKIKGTDAHTIATAKEGIAYLLIDPSSAQFRNVTIVKHEEGSPHYVKEIGGTMICGEINGKNRHGAYVGFIPFVWSKELAVGSMSPNVEQTLKETIAAHERCTSEVNKFTSGRGSAAVAAHYCKLSDEAGEKWEAQQVFDELYYPQCLKRDAPKIGDEK